MDKVNQMPIFHGSSAKAATDDKAVALSAVTADTAIHLKTKAPVLSPNAMKVLEKRYLAKNEQGHIIETHEEMFWRVARNIASADTLYDKDADIDAVATEFYRIMTALEFLPNSPTLMNAGRELQQLSACFVLPVDDSMDSIFEAIKDTALIHKSGGGTGFNFSRLRPANDKVRSTGGVASGPISFMRVFNSATEAVKQGGTRRGANMGILRVDHPDILDFIVCKKDDSSLNNFNISVGITEDFMKAVVSDSEFELVNPRTKKIERTCKAKEVFDLITEMAWKNGDPGIIFLDRINRDNPTPAIGEIESTNPCGEQPLLPYESCNLGSINLSKVVSNGKIDYKKLGDIVEKGVHFLDNVIDMNKYPIKKIAEMTRANRKIGLGVMGFADMLIEMGIPYNSEEAVKKAEEVMSFISERGNEASARLAEKRGPFPNFEKSIHNKKGGRALRNATVTTIAPTGTISIISNCSSGIEPLFAISYVRNVMDKNELVEVNPIFERVAKEGGFYSESLMRSIAEKGSIEDMKEMPKEVRSVFVVSHDITPEWHIKMQAAFQKATDNAVSKTVNFPHEATIEDVRGVYMLAYKSDCKGVTIYRDKSREEQVLNIGGAKTEEKQKPSNGHPITPRPRPKRTTGSTTRIRTSCGDLYVTINEDEKGRPFEIFCNMGKAGGCEGSQNEAVGRLISQAMRSGIDPQSIIKQLVGIRCNKPYGIGREKVVSCPDAIAKVLLEYTAIHSEMETMDLNLALETALESRPAFPCPDCGCELEVAEGCEKCHLCGYSRCG